MDKVMLKTGKNDIEDIELLSDIQHEIWSHWMKWFFENDTDENRERWKKQMNTKYDDLSEKEKESDRKVVKEFMGFLVE